jgi:hypothetical protein
LIFNLKKKNYKNEKLENNIQFKSIEQKMDLKFEDFEKIINEKNFEIEKIKK